MSKVSVTSLASLVNQTAAITTINNNFTAVQTALENTLSRDGTSPNQMESSLDMNSERIINLPVAASDTEPVRKAEFDDLTVLLANLALGSDDPLVNLSQTGYHEFAEISAPTGVSANHLRIYAIDSHALSTRLGMVDSNGVPLILSYMGSEVLRPEDFGAKGDNSTDDYTALQAMFNSVSNVGVTQVQRPTVVWMRPGAIYRTSSTPKIQQYNVKVIGNFAGIKATGAANTALMVDFAASVNNVPGVYVENLALQGATDSAAYCFWARNAPQLHIYNLICKDFATDGTSVACAGGDAIRLEGCVSYRVDHCKIDKAGGYGVNIKSNTGPHESQMGSVSHCRIYRTGNAGIRFSEGGGHTAINNDLELCTGGIVVNASFSSSIINNYFESNTTDIQYNNTTDLVGARAIQSAYIAGNDCNSTTALLLHEGDKIQVLPNRFAGNVQIDAGATNTFYFIQLQQTGSFTNSSASTTLVPAFPAIAQGDLWYGSATGVLTALAKSSSASRFLKNSGTSNNPAWAQPAFTDLSGAIAFSQLGSTSIGTVQLLAVATGVNFNSANTDTPITIALPTGYTRYRVSTVFISGASASLSTATFGLFTAAAGAGTAILTGQAITVTSASEGTNNNMQSTGTTNASTQSFNVATLYFRVQTAQGSPATGSVGLSILPVS